MARLFTSGFEVANNTAGHEWTNAGVSSAARSTTSPRTGLACGLVSGLVSGTQAGWGVSFITTADGGPYYLRFYLAVDTVPSADNCVAALVTGANVTSTSVNDAQIRLTSSRTLRLFAANSAVGSASSALTAGSYHLVELEVDNTPAAGSKIVRAYLDGTLFAGTTTSSDVGGNISGVALGGNLDAEAQTTGAWRFDDVAVNDSSGSQQNGLAGAGKVIILRPNAAGDSNQWADTSNAAGSTSNYTLVDETSPNDATDLVQSATLNNTDLYNMEASGIGASDTVNAVSVYLRRRNNVADAATAVAVVVRKTSGGTDGVSTAVVPNTTTWRTGGTTSSTVLTPSHIAYLDPDGAAWTQSTLDTMQVGCRITTGGSNRVQVSTIWAYVDYTPSTSVTGSAAGSVSVSGTATGTRSVLGAAAGSIALTGTAAATRTVRAAAAAAVAVTGAATSLRTVFAAAVGSVSIISTAAGVRTVLGAGVGQVQVTGAATGQVPSGNVTGSASGSVTLSGAATGLRTVLGSAVASVTFAGAGAGTATVLGAAAATVTLTGSAAGVRAVLAVGAATISLTGSATGLRTVFAATAGSLTVSGAATGTVPTAVEPADSGPTVTAHADTASVSATRTSTSAVAASATSTATVG